MSVVILDADAPDDEALENSHWVAEQTARSLEPLRVLRGEAVTRESTEATLQDSAVTGVVYCGHGRDDALVAPAGPVLDAANLHLVGPRWIHAFACNSGNVLSVSARREGVGAYLGYNRPVNVEWTVDELPPEVVEILREIVTAASIALHRGERSRRAIRRMIRERYDAWVRWRDGDEAGAVSMRDHMGLSALARLYDSLEFDGTLVED
ncbi:MAG: hypothetical protein R3A48_19840 [Polyangiales bacterium]